MEEEFGRIIDPSEVEAGAFRGGRWNYEGLAEALRTLFPKPKEGEVKGAEVLIEKILRYHEGELKNKAHYAKKAIEKAVKMNGWELVKIRTVGGKYVRFAVKF